jgi:hypothetical protein
MELTSTQPSVTAVNLTGMWLGSANDSSGPGQMTWQIASATASGFSGALTMTDAASHVSGRGTVSGSLSGTSIQFSLTVSAGGFSPPFNTCTAVGTGEGTVTQTSITATYTGTNSCSGPITSGQLTLTKQ